MASCSPCRSARTLEATEHAGYTPLSMPAAELAIPARSTRPSDRTTELVAPARTAHDNRAHSARGGAPPWWRRSLPNPGRAGKHASILVLYNPVRLRPSPIDPVAAARRPDHRATDGKATAGTGALGQIGKETVEGG